MHADPMSMTTASLVARLPVEAGREPWPVWISFATPCTGIFVPVYLDGLIPAAFASAGEMEPRPGRVTPSVWCAMRELQERATIDFDRTLQIIRDGWIDTEEAIEAQRIRVEREAASHYAAGKFDLGERLLSDFMATNADRMLETSQRLLAAI
jgi:hypothetical protein